MVPPPKPGVSASDPEPYTIHVPQSRLDTLKQKLALLSLPDELEGSEWDLGVPLKEVKRLKERWESGFDWRAVEERVNGYPNFWTRIGGEGKEGLGVHFLHQRSTREGAVPLLFVHGYKQYATQAGDWGFWITRMIGHLYPESCKASHLNMVYAKPPTLLGYPSLWFQNLVTPYADFDRKGLERRRWFRENSFGYNVLQSTRPQTLAYPLTDSPVGLLAWIYEKLHDWSDNYPWTDEEILTWVSLYYFSTAGPGAAGRIYYEVTHSKEYEEVLKWNGRVKLGLAHNPKDLDVFPRLWSRTLGNPIYEVVNESGGHFYATEKPELLVRDLRRMFKDGLKGV
ncbi:MAG: hypothetical protein LQ351_007110 [Letrouitia transgressa]|nr:MAG: hypothetical protein LQ351_007110 [Letrouitia transgressa]